MPPLNTSFCVLGWCVSPGSQLCLRSICCLQSRSCGKLERAAYLLPAFLLTIVDLVSLPKASHPPFWLGKGTFPVSYPHLPCRHYYGSIEPLRETLSQQIDFFWCVQFHFGEDASRSWFLKPLCWQLFRMRYGVLKNAWVTWVCPLSSSEKDALYAGPAELCLFSHSCSSYEDQASYPGAGGTGSRGYLRRGHSFAIYNGYCWQGASQKGHRTISLHSSKLSSTKNSVTTACNHQSGHGVERDRLILRRQPGGDKAAHPIGVSVLAMIASSGWGSIHSKGNDLRYFEGHLINHTSAQAKPDSRISNRAFGQNALNSKLLSLFLIAFHFQRKQRMYIFVVLAINLFCFN